MTLQAKGYALFTHVASLEEIKAVSGLEFLRRIASGEVAQPPICHTLGCRLADVAITETTGPIRAEGRTLHLGRRSGTAEGKILDANGTLLAHGTTTCLVFAL